MKNLLDQATPKLARTPQKRIKMYIEEQEPWTGNWGIGESGSIMTVTL
jgi:hypothetical protein